MQISTASLIPILNRRDLISIPLETGETTSLFCLEQDEAVLYLVICKLFDTDGCKVFRRSANCLFSKDLSHEFVIVVHFRAIPFEILREQNGNEKQ